MGVGDVDLMVAVAQHALTPTGRGTDFDGYTTGRHGAEAPGECIRGGAQFAPLNNIASAVEEAVMAGLVPKVHADTEPTGLCGGSSGQWFSVRVVFFRRVPPVCSVDHRCCC